MDSKRRRSPRAVPSLSPTKAAKAVPAKAMTPASASPTRKSVKTPASRSPSPLMSIAPGSPTGKTPPRSHKKGKKRVRTVLPSVTPLDALKLLGTQLSRTVHVEPMRAVKSKKSVNAFPSWKPSLEF